MQQMDWLEIWGVIFIKIQSCIVIFKYAVLMLEYSILLFNSCIVKCDIQMSSSDIGIFFSVIHSWIVVFKYAVLTLNYER